MAKKNKANKLKYHLDHPQIKRHPSPGNGEVPGPQVSADQGTKSKFGGFGSMFSKGASMATKPKEEPLNDTATMSGLSTNGATKTQY